MFSFRHIFGIQTILLAIVILVQWQDWRNT